MSGRQYHVLLLLWVSCLVTGLLLAFAAYQSGPLPGDLALSRALQQTLPPAGTLGSLFGVLGDAAWVLPVAAVLVAILTRRWRPVVLLLVAALGATFVAEVILAPIVERPRPSENFVRVYDRAGGYGYPSGTSMMTIATLGAVAHLIRRPGRLGTALVAAIGVLIVLIGLSRVHAGAHWVSDVLGGWLLGIAWLLPAHVLYQQARRDRQANWQERSESTR